MCEIRIVKAVTLKIEASSQMLQDVLKVHSLTDCFYTVVNSVYLSVSTKNARWEEIINLTFQQSKS